MSSKLDTIRLIASKLEPTYHDKKHILFGTPGWKSIRKRTSDRARLLYEQAVADPAVAEIMAERVKLDEEILEAGTALAALTTRRKNLPRVDQLIVDLVLQT